MQWLVVWSGFWVDSLNKLQMWNCEYVQCSATLAVSWWIVSSCKAYFYAGCKPFESKIGVQWNDWILWWIWWILLVEMCSVQYWFPETCLSLDPMQLIFQVKVKTNHLFWKFERLLTLGIKLSVAFVVEMLYWNNLNIAKQIGY